MRIFLDTNVLASGLATRGLCSEVLEGVLHDHELLTCDQVLVELERVLVGKMHVPEDVTAKFLALLREEGHLVRSQKTPTVRIKDPDDIPILACAIAAEADFFATGDKALLDLEEVDGLRIVSPRQLWTTLAGL